MEKKDDTGAEIIYHFKVVQHRIPLTQFIDTAKATEAILDDFNRQFFGGKLKYKLNVAPAEEGSIKSVFTVTVISGAIWGFLISDIGEGFIKGLTTQTPAEWSEQIGTGIRQKLFNFIDDMNATDLKKDTLSKEVEESFLAILPPYFLSEGLENLETVGITPDDFHEAFKARNKFYKACQDNIEVQGLSFDRTDKFPITKNHFQNFIVDLPDESLQLFSEIVNIAVNSPNWENDARRGWQGKYNKNQHIKFVIKDEVFWQRVRDNKINPTIKDIMQVQWVYQMKDGKRKDVRVLKVLSFNNDPISKPISDEEIRNKYKAKKKNPDNSLDLFVVQTDEDKNNSSND